MPLLDWKSEYSVGIIEIDSQHKKIVSLINQLFDAMKIGKGNAVLGQIINDLFLYAQLHFRTEEKYFDAFDYEEASKHTAEHEAFINEIRKFKTAFENGSITLSISVLNFLKDWLDHHILGEDKKYIDCFKQNGLS